MDDKDVKRIEAHLQRTFGNKALKLKARPKQKDFAEVFIGQGEDAEFIGIVYQDEDEDGSFMFEMAILSEDLEA